MPWPWTKSAVAAAFGALSTLICASAQAQFPTPTPAKDLDSPAIVFAFSWPETRAALARDALEAGSTDGAPYALSAYLPAGPLAGIGDPLRGKLIVPDAALTVRALGAKTDAEIPLPAIIVDLISHGDRLVTLRDAEDAVIRSDRRYSLHFGVGRIWREAADGPRSRAVLPVTLIDSRHRIAYNGLAGFLYGAGEPPSPMLFQFSQETAPERAADLWASVPVTFRDREPPNMGIRIAAYERQQATAPEFRDWDALPAEAAVMDFDGALGAAGSISASGIVVDEIVYVKGCHTRAGPYPFCRQMRHALGAASGGLLSFAAVSHLTSRFGTEVLRDPIAKRLPELQGHPVWRRATPLDVLNMASGGGTTESDADQAATVGAETRTEILDAAARTPSLGTAPGTMYRYRPGDLMVLSVALDAHAKSRFGPNGSLRQVLEESFFKPMGLRRVQIQMTGGAAPWDRVPDLATGFYPTTGELGRMMAALMRTLDRTKKSGFDGALGRDVLRSTEALGLETGLKAKAGAMRWHLGFWRRPVAPTPDCLRHIAVALGRGGTVLSFMPNRVGAFRLADGDPTAPSTRDSAALRATGHAIRPFCG